MKAMLTYILMAVGLFAIGWEAQKNRHTCPAPTITYVQEYLGVEPDGKAGPVTLEAWRKMSADEERKEFDAYAIELMGE